MESTYLLPVKNLTKQQRDTVIPLIESTTLACNREGLNYIELDLFTNIIYGLHDFISNYKLVDYDEFMQLVLEHKLLT